MIFDCPKTVIHLKSLKFEFLNIYIYIFIKTFFRLRFFYVIYKYYLYDLSKKKILFLCTSLLILFSGVRLL